MLAGSPTHRCWLPSFFCAVCSGCKFFAARASTCTFMHALIPSKSWTNYRWGNKNQTSAPKDGCSDPVQRGRELQWHQDFILESWIPLEKCSAEPRHKRCQLLATLALEFAHRFEEQIQKLYFQAGNPFYHTFLIYTDAWYTPHVSPPSLTHICNGSVPYLSDEKLRPVVTASMRSFILKGCYISTLLLWGKLEKTPKAFSPSLTWKLLWRHLISLSCLLQAVEILEVGKFIPTNFLYESHPRFYVLHLISSVWGGCGRFGQHFLLKCISAGKVYSKPAAWDLLRGEIKQGITSGLLRPRDQAKDRTHKLTHLPAGGNRGTFISVRSEVTWVNSGSESHQKTGKCSCFFHSALCCWLDLCETSSVPQTCPLGSVWH